MLKELFDKGKCALGFHSGDWRYVKDQQCQQLQVCSRCKAVNHQVVHTWQAWQYLASEACEMARQCGRCHEQENKLEHAWNPPVYESAESCVQVRPCSRCGEKSAAGTAHVWNRWSYETEGQCSQISGCSRCGAMGAQKRLAHDWGNWSKSQFYRAPVRVCHRCGELIFDLGDGKTEKDFISLQRVGKAVQEIMESKDSDGVRERITRHSAVLFSPVTEKYFNFAVDQLATTDDDKDTFRKLAGLIDRCRKEGVTKVFSPPVSPAPQPTGATSSSAPTQQNARTSSALDQRLLGHWRHTEILGSGSFTHTIDTHCILDPSGRMQWYSRSASGTRGPEDGTWSASNGTLNLIFDSGDRLVFAYVIEGSNMLFPREGRYKFWQRIN